MQRRLKFVILLVFAGSYFQARAQQEKSYKIVSIAFYNVENLFDTENDPFTFDDDRTPEGKDAWTEEKYREKLQNLAKVISEIGIESAQVSPAIIGLAEVENYRVLEDLVNQPALKNKNYGIIHYDSPDSRGIDVAMLYQKSVFAPTSHHARKLSLSEPGSPKPEKTRDQLVVSGKLDGENFSFIINHWPSRSGGEKASEYKRIRAAELNRKIIDSIFQNEPYMKIVNMGDFNDDPHNRSIKTYLKTGSVKKDLKLQELFNPMEKMQKEGSGTLAYRDGWNLFDQIMLSGTASQNEYDSYQYYKAGIFNKSYLITPKGQFRGYPLRTYGYSGYQGGYSDHFPVYIYLIKESASATN
ncbi:endonuclease/exonuclease/phosphatase family protein [Salegentibacter chungangensis]|uniref:Endonuclease/exonuclease/phosphatase family protein n=1 Tax=Salegentibacter chungangensis TaxID=1335724 RepID=A0ABW3NNW9_9FLAO